MLLLKKRYSFRLLLNEKRASQDLITSGRGETQIWAWIHDLMYESAAMLPLPLTQKLLKSSLDHDVSPALMLASAGNKFRVIARVPALWRNFLKKRGCKIHFMSAIFWQIEILRKFREGLRAYDRLSAQNVSAPSAPYAVLNNIHDNTYSSVFQNDKAQDFLKWFYNKFSYKNYWIIPVSPQPYKTVDNFSLVSSPFPALEAAELTKFQMLAKRAVIGAFLKLIIGKWQDAYMLADRLEEIYITCLPANKLARLYAFTNAYYIYRPLWTYEAEKRGAEIALIFYATNSFNIELISRQPNGVAPGYAYMSWPHIYTQHENHKNFMQRTILKKPQIHLTNLIPYEDSGAEFHLQGKLKILYLDVQPFRPAFMASIGRPCHFYTEDISQKSLEDIVSITSNLDARLFIKSKRSVGKKMSPRYRRKLKEIENLAHVQIIESHISPQRVCEEADIIICQPFTTAALFAQQAGKPVVYYDAQGFFTRDQMASQGVPLVSGPVELESWLHSLKA